MLAVYSLAKGFGVPVAVLAGSTAMMHWFRGRSETRVHCSLPSIAVTYAAEHALTVNEKQADVLRLRLAQRVSRFRKTLVKYSFSTIGRIFPIQTLMSLPELDARILHERLLQLGVRTVLHHACNGHGARLSLLLNALHNADDIEYAADALAFATRNIKAKT